jgi:hypothetical protein
VLIDERVAELGERPPDHLPPPEGDQEDPTDRQERRGMECEDALGRGRVDGDTRRPEPAVEEHLDESAPIE